MLLFLGVIYWFFLIIKNYEDDVHKTKQGPASLSRSKFFSTEPKYNKLSPYFDAFTRWLELLQGPRGIVLFLDK